MTETLLKLRCPMASCDAMPVTAPSAGYTAGQMVKVEDTVLVIVETALVGVEVAAIYRAPKIVVPKVAGTGKTITKGDKVYFKSASAAVTGDSTSNTLCGRALEDATADDDEIEIDFNGAAAA